MVYDMSEPCQFSSLDHCQKRFLWTHKEAHFSPHPVGGLVNRVGDAVKFPQELGFKAWILFSESASRLHVSLPWRRMEVTRDLYSLNLLAKLTVLHRQILCRLAISVIAEAILIRTSAKQMPFSHRVAHRYLKLVASSIFWPFMLSALTLFVLLVMILLFFVRCSVSESVAEVLKFTIATAHKIDIVSKP